MTATRWWQRNGDYVFALGEMAVYSGDANVALGATVRADTATAWGTWRDEYLVDGYTSQGRIVEWPGWLRELSDRRATLEELRRLSAQHQRLVNSALLEATVSGGALVVIALLALLVFAYRTRLRQHHEIAALRSRIAADLHDEIGSNVGSIALLARIIQSDAKMGGEVQLTVQEIQRTATQTLDSMREIVWLIHPGHDRLEELIDHLRDFSRTMLAGVDCTFEASPEPNGARLSLETRRSLYLIFKELLHNVAKHSQAGRVHISISERHNGFELNVEDNGVGFDTSRKSSGHGLDNLRRRAEKIGGELLIDSRPGNGTRVRLRVQHG
jgi:signal transduction histidine kinase